MHTLSKFVIIALAGALITPRIIFGMDQEAMRARILAAREENERDRLRADAERERLRLNNKLCEAALRGHRNWIRPLIEQGADINGPCPRIYNGPPLLAAAWYGHADTVAELLAAGAQVDASNSRGETSLHYAASAGHEAVVDRLLAAGADARAADRNSDTPLHRAATGGHDVVIQRLIMAGADARATDRDGKTPLHLAALFSSGNREATVQALLQAGAEVNAPDKRKDSPLHIAAYRGNYQAVAPLLEAGANPLARNNEGEIPLELALASEQHTQRRGPQRPHEYAQTIELLQGAMTTQQTWGTPSYEAEPWRYTDEPHTIGRW